MGKKEAIAGVTLTVCLLDTIFNYYMAMTRAIKISRHTSFEGDKQKWYKCASINPYADQS